VDCSLGATTRDRKTRPEKLGLSGTFNGGGACSYGGGGGEGATTVQAYTQMRRRIDISEIARRLGAALIYIRAKTYRLGLLRVLCVHC
jgi:hypothetical protein